MKRIDPQTEVLGFCHTCFRMRWLAVVFEEEDFSPDHAALKGAPARRLRTLVAVLARGLESGECRQCDREKGAA